MICSKFGWNKPMQRFHLRFIDCLIDCRMVLVSFGYGEKEFLGTLMYLNKHVSLHTKNQFGWNLNCGDGEKIKSVKSFKTDLIWKVLLSSPKRRADQSLLVTAVRMSVYWTSRSRFFCSWRNVTLVSVGCLSCSSCRDRGQTVWIPRVVWMTEVF